MMHVTCIILETRSVVSSKMINSADNTITTLAKSVTYRSFCQDNYSKCYYNHYMEQLANTQAFRKCCQKIRQQYYFPSIATYFRNRVRDCEIRIQEKCTKNTRITPEIIHIPEWDLGPEDLMQNDLLPELPPSGDYGDIIAAVDVFWRYAFAYPVSNPTAVNTAEVIINIMTRHAYLSTLNVMDTGSVFVSQVIHRVAEILGINLKPATTKHA